MSEGIFMDGGGHDHVGHGHGTFMDGGHDHGTFMDGGGHDHNCQHGHGTAHHGTQGVNLSQVLGLQQNHHSFLAHLLGLDHDAHHGHLHGTMAEGGAEGHQTFGSENISEGTMHSPDTGNYWMGVFQSLNPAHMLEGIKITPNFLLACMFVGFTTWLFVLYWIRHHEPLANQVIGSGAAHCATSNADRKLMERTRDAFPLRTTPNMGNIYVPTPGIDSDPNVHIVGSFIPQNAIIGSPQTMQPPPEPIVQPAQVAPPMAQIPPQPAQPYTPMVNPYGTPTGSPPLLAPQTGWNSAAAPLPSQMVAPAQPQMSAPVPAQQMSQYTAVYVPVKSGDSTRLKMVVSR